MRGRSVPMVAVVAAAGLCAAQLLAGEVAAAGVPAATAGNWGKAVEVPGTAALNTGGNGAASSVSCAASSCAGGGAYRDGSGHEQGFVVSQVRGRWGKAIEVPGLAALNKGGGSSIDSVSCAAAGSCAAGGGYIDGSGRIRLFVVSQVRGRWGKAIEVPGLAALNKGGALIIFMDSVSCGAAGSCAAGGFYSDGSGHAQGFVVSQVRGRWGKAIEVPGLAALNTGGFGAIDSVSCAAASCAAGGFYRDGSGHPQGFVVSQVRGRWGKAIEVPGLAALNTGGNGDVSSVSCAAGSCAMGGSYTDGSGHARAFVASQVRGRWGKAIEVPGLAALDKRGSVIDSVSCAAAGSCAAGGSYTDGSGHAQVFVASQVRGKWGKAIEVPGLAALQKGGYAAISVSCAAAGSCAAGGLFYADASGQARTAFVASQVRGKWGKAIEVPGLAALDKRGSAIESVSCAAAGNCAAGGGYTDGSGHSQAFVVAGSVPALAGSRAVVYYACVSRAGAVKVVPKSDRCPGGQHKISWNNTGPRGPAGLPGSSHPKALTAFQNFVTRRRTLSSTGLTEVNQLDLPRGAFEVSATVTLSGSGGNGNVRCDLQDNGGRVLDSEATNFPGSGYGSDALVGATATAGGAVAVWCRTSPGGADFVAYSSLNAIPVSSAKITNKSLANSNPVHRMLPLAGSQAVVYYACVSGAGAIRIVRKSGKCSGGGRKISWSNTGPRGPAGPQGPPSHDALVGYQKFPVLKQIALSDAHWTEIRQLDLPKGAFEVSVPVTFTASGNKGTVKCMLKDNKGHLLDTEETSFPNSGFGFLALGGATANAGGAVAVWCRNGAGSGDSQVETSLNAIPVASVRITGISLGGSRPFRRTPPGTLPAGADRALARSRAVVYYACVSKDGAVKIVSSSATCPSGRRKISWNKTGPRGSAGPDGVPGTLTSYQNYPDNQVGLTSTGPTEVNQLNLPQGAFEASATVTLWGSGGNGNVECHLQDNKGDILDVEGANIAPTSTARGFLALSGATTSAGGAVAVWCVDSSGSQDFAADSSVTAIPLNSADISYTSSSASRPSRRVLP